MQCVVCHSVGAILICKQCSMPMHFGAKCSAAGICRACQPAENAVDQKELLPIKDRKNVWDTRLGRHEYDYHSRFDCDHPKALSPKLKAATPASAAAQVPFVTQEHSYPSRFDSDHPKALSPHIAAAKAPENALPSVNLLSKESEYPSRFDNDHPKALSPHIIPAKPELDVPPLISEAQKISSPPASQQLSTTAPMSFFGQLPLVQSYSPAQSVAGVSAPTGYYPGSIPMFPTTYPHSFVTYQGMPMTTAPVVNPPPTAFGPYATPAYYPYPAQVLPSGYGYSFPATFAQPQKF